MIGHLASVNQRSTIDVKGSSVALNEDVFTVACTNNVILIIPKAVRNYRGSHRFLFRQENILFLTNTFIHFVPFDDQ